MVKASRKRGKRNTRKPTLFSYTIPIDDGAAPKPIWRDVHSSYLQARYSTGCQKRRLGGGSGIEKCPEWRFEWTTRLRHARGKDSYLNGFGLSRDGYLDGPTRLLTGNEITHAVSAYRAWRTIGAMAVARFAHRLSSVIIVILSSARCCRTDTSGGLDIDGPL